MLKEQKRNVEEQMRQKRKKMSQDQDAIFEQLSGADDIQTYYDGIIRQLNEANVSCHSFFAFTIEIARLTIIVIVSG